ncbi:MAG: rhomboid family intramembrane serine protease [Rhodobacteraceae bacterium]|nr:rhomboid family intramembrane serine protease [Paracoccaceae bacterium]
MAYQEPPAVNPIPPAVLALTAIIIGIEIVFWLASRGVLGGAAGIGWRLAAFEDYAFIPRYLAFMIQEGSWSVDGLKRFITYAFINQSFLSAVFSSVFILAFGKFIGDIAGGARALFIFVVSAVGAALLYGVIFPNQPPLVGSFPGAYGLLGGYTYILFATLDRADQNRLQAFRLVGMLAALQLAFGVIFPGPPYWLADLAGALVGFLAAATMNPGGIARIVELLRRR